MLVGNLYDEKYSSEQCYWGKRHSRLSAKILHYLQPRADFRPRLLDLGCGEGRDAIYLAIHGFDVTGLDLSPVGLDKMRRYAEQAGVRVQIMHADLAACQFASVYEVIMSVGALHYLAPELRQGGFEQYKRHTSSGGLNAFSVFVEKPFIPAAPDPQANGVLFRSGELLAHYWDWEILWCDERIVNCQSGGVPHRHGIAEMIARKPPAAKAGG